MTMETTKLKSCDGIIFTVNMEVAKLSGTICHLLECFSADDGESIPIALVRGEILEKVITWGELYLKSEVYPPPVVPEPYRWPLPSDDLCEWEEEFMDVDIATVIEIISAANYLDIKELMDLACKSIANRITGKSPQEIRKIFKVNGAAGFFNSLSPESGDNEDDDKSNGNDRKRSATTKTK